MNSAIVIRLRKLIDQAPVWILFILGFWFVVMRPLGSNFTLVPGELDDARFLCYILEHFYNWTSGYIKNYWNGPFFFPYRQTILFGDTLLGSAPIYVLFRWIGLDIYSAFQGWYALGFVFNFASASFVLSRLKLKSLAIGFGAFFFTFGLPQLAQENHAQLLYRFCIPLACFSLWSFFQTTKLKNLVLIIACIVWQFFLSPYVGIFLLLLIGILSVLLIVYIPGKTFIERILFYPRSLISSWSHASHAERAFGLVSIIILILCFTALYLQYNHVSTYYGLSRRWGDISVMLPRLQSYLLADNSLLWNISKNISPYLPYRHEHQLFPGLSVLLFTLIGVIWRFNTDTTKIAWWHFPAIIILVTITLDVNGLSIFLPFQLLPGLNNIRAISRIILVLMWPLALFTAWAMDGFIRFICQRRRWMKTVAYMVTGLLMMESVFYTHTTFDKGEAIARIDSLREQIPVRVPEQPVLFVEIKDEQFWLNEIDAMLLSQELGWSTINGYSGFFPPGYEPAYYCKYLPKWFETYMDFTGSTSQANYLGMMKRVVPIGFTDCDPTWWKMMP